MPAKARSTAPPATGAPADLDAITVEQLRRAGSLKWTLYPDALGAFLAEMDFGTAPAVTEALHDLVEAGLFGYLPRSVAADQSAACAAWQRARYGWEVGPEQVHLVPDVIKGLELAIEHFSTSGAKVVLPVPAYMPFFHVPRSLGREIIEVPLTHGADGYRMDLEALDAAFAAGGSLLVLCNPYNPVGRVFERDELVAISAVVQRHGGRVFADEIHAPLVYPGATHVPYASVSATTAGHTVTAVSASKAWNLPGLKCAQLIVTNDADAATWEEIEASASHGVANPGVVANTAAYTRGGPWLDGIVAYLDTNRRRLAELLAEHLPEVGYTPPQGTYIGWLDCRPLLDRLGPDTSPADFFRTEAGVALTDGAACGAPGFVRLVFATPAPVLEEAVTRMGTAIQARRAA